MDIGEATLVPKPDDSGRRAEDKPDFNEALFGKMRSKPGEVVRQIFAESVPEEDRNSPDYWKQFGDKGFSPQGATLEEAKKALEQAQLDEQSGVSDIRDLMGIKSHVLLREAVTNGLFGVTVDGGIQISQSKIEELRRSNDPDVSQFAALLSRISGFRGERLLLGLYAARCNSLIARQAGAILPRETKVIYLHENGTKTELIIRNGDANILTQLAEDALIANTGKI